MAAALMAGLLALVDGAWTRQWRLVVVGAAEAERRRAAWRGWEYADEIRRLDPWIAVLGAALNLDDAALYELFALEQAL